jgi:hypothetical protein
VPLERGVREGSPELFDVIRDGGEPDLSELARSVLERLERIEALLSADPDR